MKIRLIILLCCMSLSLMSLAQASGGQIRRVQPKKSNNTTTTKKRNTPARTNTKQTQWTDSEGHVYVDLGLPSGTLWATCNIGASSPEGYGDYFAWGETKAKTTYSWNTYKWCNGTFDKLTKYCNDSNYGLIDNKSWLEPADDAAYVNWGPAWRIPSQEQFEELLNNTNNTWTALNGVHGWKFTSKTNSSIFVFLPAAGWRNDSSLNVAGSGGYYWSRTLYTSYPYYARYLLFYSGRVDTGSYYRCDGRSVRPVRVAK